MNRTIKPFLFIIPFLFLIYASLYAGKNTLPCSVKLTNGTISYTIQYDEGKKEWAGYIKKMTNIYLEAAEIYLSVPFPKDSGFVIDGREEVYLHLKGSSLDGVKIGGYNLWDEVALEYGISEIGNPALVFHELGHFWFPDGELKWMLEGVVSYLPLAMADEGMLELDKSEYAKIRNHWGLEYTQYETDLPLLYDFRGKNENTRSFFYMKTFKLQYLLHRELGKDGYSKLLSKYSSIIKNCSSDDLLLLLNTYKKSAWKDFLTGWVFPGKYGDVRYDDFSDPDCDNLLSIDEYYIKTRPDKADSDGDLVPDGTELALGLDPLKSAGKKQTQQIIMEHGPFIDGEKTDWELLPCVIKQDKVDDAEKSEYNMLSMWYGFRGGYLSLYVKTGNPPMRGENIMFDVLADLDADGKTDREFAFRLDNPSQTWTYYYATGTHENIDNLYGGLNSGFEISIPRDSIGGAMFRILPIVRDWEKEVNFDEWDRWVPVNLTILGKVEAYALRTDLLKADADKDGIPDVAELTYHLDPVKPDSRAMVKKYGPFIDGIDSEWKVLKTQTSSDPEADAKNRGYDLRKIYYLVKESVLFLMVETADTPGDGSGIMFDILVDSNIDKQSDLDFAFFLENPESPWNYSVALGKSFFPPGLISAKDEVIEMAIPLSAVGTNTFQILPIIRDDVKKINYDEWSSWIKINSR